jgi:hypothetical protein
MPTPCGKQAKNYLSNNENYFSLFKDDTYNITKIQHKTQKQ